MCYLIIARIQTTLQGRLKFKRDIRTIFTMSKTVISRPGYRNKQNFNITIHIKISFFSIVLAVFPAIQTKASTCTNVDLQDSIREAQNNNNPDNIQLVINEFMASNSNTIQDSQGDFDDWIEIYNYGDTPVNIGGMFFTDDLSAPDSWRIPDDNPDITTVFPMDYLLIWADGEPSDGPLHLDFKLNAEGEAIGLFDTDSQTLIDGLTFGNQIENTSYGRFPDGGNNWQIFEIPTPGQPNKDTISPVVINEIMYHPYHSDTSPENIWLEYIEFFNLGAESVNLGGWQLTGAVEFTFPNDIVLNPGDYLVVTAEKNNFSAKYPGIINAIGNWNGKLSNSGEEIELKDTNGNIIDRVRYTDGGDWALRRLGPEDYGHRGWEWITEHDGEGKSLELINPALPNEYGQNWNSSKIKSGTPGTVNSIQSNDIAPLILNVTHFPIIPGAHDSVTVTAYIIDESNNDITVTLHYLPDSSYFDESDSQAIQTYPHHEPGDFFGVTMYDDGEHDDSQADDGIYAAEIPPYPDGSIIEFYIQARDNRDNVRTWPAASIVDGNPEQVTNLLYQVDDNFNLDNYMFAGTEPIHYLIMTETERGRLEYLGRRENESWSHAQMNGTLISIEDGNMNLNYNVSIRNRGHGSRRSPPNNYRINFKSDNTFEGLTAININSKYTYLQYFGNVLFKQAGLPAPNAVRVQVRVNGENLALNDPERMYGSYIRIEVYDKHWAKNHIPEDNDGNLYRCLSDSRMCDLRYLGEDPNAYRTEDLYRKTTNSAENDWLDLINLTYALDESTDETYIRQLQNIANTDQWLRWFALEILISNNETNISTGRGDDYYLYRGLKDPRFILLPHDLDTILNWSDREDSIWQATSLPVIDRFLRHPEFIGRYFNQFENLIETIFDPENFNPLIEQHLGDWVPQSKIEEIKAFVEARIAYIRSEIPPDYITEYNKP